MTPVCQTVATSPPPIPSPAGWFSTRAQIAVISCACAGATTFLYAVDPNRHAVYPQCLLYNLTGFYCAGCGATRACHALLHGRLVEALHDNALFIGALPVLLFLAASHALTAWHANAWPKVPLDERKLLWRALSIFALMTAFMIARNLPGPPFDWLKPLPPSF
jgi:hypothetical protein